ncbi:DMT family transporter [Algibacillus agarilyticus]|uniref:DMT family transporter n=1 Tax=Algibacillus agarilyticus TaxID=2234133 RepID=UPI000DD02ECA|nr:EamA family transporter [Algibacillus agarilyticus]
MSFNKEIAKAYQIGLAGIVVMSTVPVAIKWVSADPWVIGFCRLIIATTALYFLRPAIKALNKLTTKDYLILAALGLCFGLHWITYFFAIKLGSATIAVIATISTYGLYLSVAGRYFLGHAVKPYHWFALLLGIAGTVLVGGQFDLNSNALIGFILGIVSGCFYGTLPIIHQKSTHLNGDIRTFGQFAGALVIFTFCIPLGDWQIKNDDWLGLIYLGLVGTVVAHSLWVYAVTALPTTVSGLIKYLYIPLTATLSYFILDEKLTALQLLGGVIVISGCILGVLGDKIFNRK